jgi:FdhD protein
MKDVGSVDYEIHRVEGLTREISADCIAIEEPLEIIEGITRAMIGSLSHLW